MSYFVVLILSSFVLAACNPLDSKVKAGLQVETGTVSSTLFLDGQYLDKTPFINKDIKPGSYTLKIQPDDPNLVPSEMQVNLRQGLLTVVTWLPGAAPEVSGGVVYEMEKLPSGKEAQLSVVTIPDAAIIKLDGREKEFAPLSINNLTPGEKEYEISLPSYDPQKHTVNLIEGYKTTITIKLAKSQLEPTRQPASSLPSVLGATATTSSALSRLTASISSSLALPPKPSPVAGSKVRIKATGFEREGVEGLRIRDSAGADSNEIGFAATGSELVYLKESLAGWYKVQFDGKIGWVSSHYAEVLP